MGTRQEVGELGEKIVAKKLIDKGWCVVNANIHRVNQPNFDLEAERDGRLIRIQVKAKRHKEKASLGGAWHPGKPYFNKAAEFPKAEFLIMIRFTSLEENECFVLPIKEAEEEAEWFASELIKLNKSTSQLYPFVGTRDRITVYPFNTREHWETYKDAWHYLNA